VLGDLWHILTSVIYIEVALYRRSNAALRLARLRVTGGCCGTFRVGPGWAVGYALDMLFSGGRIARRGQVMICVTLGECIIFPL
jgi:hypothetical protein